LKTRKQIIIGSRGSKLALIQAESVLEMLKEAHPNLEFSLVKIRTQGDSQSQISLRRIGGQGVFVKEIEEVLLDGGIDIAVHSLKDMPTEIPQGLSLAAATQRLDPRDALVSRGGKLAELPSGSRLGTGSQRRAVQILAFRPDFEICDIRGNVDTRLRKVFSREVDGVVLAASALIRLGLESVATEYLPLEHFVPAVGQGALGIEIRAEDKEVAGIVSCLNYESAWRSVRAERAFLKALGGGCRAPIAAFGEVKGKVLHLRGMVASPDGSAISWGKVESSVDEPERAGARLAQNVHRNR
jgi:hydroxymethylbilane synthase